MQEETQFQETVSRHVWLAVKEGKFQFLFAGVAVTDPSARCFFLCACGEGTLSLQMRTFDCSANVERIVVTKCFFFILPF